MVGFFDIIQAYFTKLTGRFIMFSGRDLVLLQEWKGQGASAAAICRGIRDAVINMHEQKPPRDLYNCRAWIEPHVERARARIVQDPVAKLREAGLVEQSVTQRAMSNLERVGGACKNPKVRELYRTAWYQVRDLEREGRVDEQYSKLLVLEEHLADAYFSTLSDEVRRQLDRRIEDEVSSLGLRMSEHAWTQHMTARRRYLMMREFGLQPLVD